MPENVSFSFELVDKVTASASRMERSLVNIERALTRTQGSARAGSGSWAMFGIKMGAVAGIAAEVTRSLLELGGQVLKMGATGAKWALEAGSFNENTQLSLEAILGSASAAQKAVSAWGALAENTPFDVRNVIEWGKQLTVAGESVENTVTVLKAVSDLGAKLGSTPEKQRAIAQQTIDMFSRIKQLGSEASVRNLREFANLGISPGMIEKNLADRLTGGNVAALRKGMETARQTGQDMSHEIVLAALQAVQDTTGKLGTTGAKAATTLSSLFTRAQERVQFDIFKGFEKTAGYKAVKGVLQNLIDVLDPRSASGKAILSGIKQISDALGSFLGPLTGKEGRTNMVAFFNDMKTAIENALPSVMNIANAVGFLAKWGIVKPVQGLSMLTDIGSDVAGMVSGALKRGQESATTRDLLYAAFGESGLPGGSYSRPSAGQRAAFDRAINMNTTVHVHGDASTDNLVEKINAAQEQNFYEWLEKTNILAGAQ